MEAEPSMFKSVGIFRGLEYLESLQKPDGRTPVILEWLAEDIHSCKEVIAKQLGKMKNFRGITMSVLGMMIKGDKRYSINATYIMAMLSETDLVMKEILTAKENDFISAGDSSQPKSLLAIISCVIHNGDEQSVSNGLALLGNLLKTKDGITWLLANSVLSLNDLLDDVISMVSITSPTSSSNAELIIGRMCSLEKGRNLVSCHPFFDQLISHLIFSLESVDKKVVQNAVYALAELCHSRFICRAVINTQWATNMMENLSRLLTSDHIPIKIHSCKALQSLASSDEGFNFLNEFQDSENMLSSLITMFDSSVESKEIGVAIVRFLMEFVEHQDGYLRICQNQNICMLLKHYELNFTNIPDTLKNEISLLNQRLEFLSQPEPPTLLVQGARSILVNYVCQEDTIYELWQGTTVIYSGQEDFYLVEELEPYTEYSFRLRLLHECNKSPFSAVVIARTLEGEPGECLHVSAKPISCHQVQLLWDIPLCINGLFKEYKVYTNDSLVISTTETYTIVSGLLPQQRYKFEVSCVNCSHEGSRVTVWSKTFPEVYNATSRPSVVMLSDQEVFITWQKPLHLPGDLLYYELNINGKVIYSGLDTKYTVKTLDADKTYEFMVAVVSTEVTARSETVCRKTPKSQSNSTKLSLLSRSKNKALDLQNGSLKYDDDLKASKSDSDINKDSPDHVSGQMMQYLLDQYSNNYNSIGHGNEVHNPLLPKQKTLSICDQKQARLSYQNSSLTAIRNSCSKTRKEHPSYV